MLGHKNNTTKFRDEFGVILDAHELEKLIELQSKCLE